MFSVFVNGLLSVYLFPAYGFRIFPMLIRECSFGARTRASEHMRVMCGVFRWAPNFPRPRISPEAVHTPAHPKNRTPRAFEQPCRVEGENDGKAAFGRMCMSCCRYVCCANARVRARPLLATRTVAREGGMQMQERNCASTHLCLQQAVAQEHPSSFTCS